VAAAPFQFGDGGGGGRRWDHLIFTYIKSVLASIPVYYMSIVLFCRTFVERINAIIKKFWCTSAQEDNPTSPTAFRSWEDICQPKENGGLGIRDLYTVNKSLITHAVYDIANNINPFLTAVHKAKYFHNNSFWTTNTIGPRPFFGLPFCRLKGTFVTTLHTKFMQVTHSFGQLRIPSTTIHCFL
jgi:hypothetical protein